MNLSKITVSNNFVQIHTGEGGGVIELGNPEGRGAQAVLEIQVDGGGAFHHLGVDFFWNNPIFVKATV